MFNSANIDAAVEGAITAKFRHTAQVFIDHFSPKINHFFSNNIMGNKLFLILAQNFFHFIWAKFHKTIEGFSEKRALEIFG